MKNYKKRSLGHLKKVGLALLTGSLMVSPSFAVDPVEPVSQVIALEESRKSVKMVIDSALNLTKGKPAMSLATIIVCGACLLVAGAPVSAGLCIACGVLITKTFG